MQKRHPNLLPILREEVSRAMKLFEVTEKHIKLLKRAYVEWLEIESGAPAIDPKRPYGNSDVVKDVAEILGLEPIIDRYGEKTWTHEQGKLCEKLHRETEYALQIFLCMGEIKPGVYIQKDKYNTREWWKE
jgi:hypothetical protein